MRLDGALGGRGRRSRSSSWPGCAGRRRGASGRTPCAPRRFCATCWPVSRRFGESLGAGAHARRADRQPLTRFLALAAAAVAPLGRRTPRSPLRRKPLGAADGPSVVAACCPTVAEARSHRWQSRESDGPSPCSDRRGDAGRVAAGSGPPNGGVARARLESRLPNGRGGVRSRWRAAVAAGGDGSFADQRRRTSRRRPS